MPLPVDPTGGWITAASSLLGPAMQPGIAQATVTSNPFFDHSGMSMGGGTLPNWAWAAAGIAITVAVVLIWKKR